MSRQALLRFLPRLAIAWLLLTMGVMACGVDLVWLSRALVEPAVQAACPGFAAIMTGANGKLGEVGMTFDALAPIQLAGQYFIGRGARFEESIPASQDLLPAVLLLSLIAASPHQNWTRGLRSVLLGTVAGAAIFLLTVTMHFSAQFEVILQGFASNIHQQRAVPTFMAQYIFIILGGEWLISIASAVLILGYSSRNNSIIQKVG